MNYKEIPIFLTRFVMGNQALGLYIPCLWIISVLESQGIK